MRTPSPRSLVESVRDFRQAIGVLPHWANTSTPDDQDRGHYEWVHWGEALRAADMWQFGGPWRTLIADIKMAKLLTSIEFLHELKEHIVWEIVEQVYNAAEYARHSRTPSVKIKARIRSVHSWQQRHSVNKHTLLSFLDFAFVLSAYDEYQAERQFIDRILTDPVKGVPRMTPGELVAYAAALETEMINARRLPFYAKVAGLPDRFVLDIRLQAFDFCDGLDPPKIEMLPEVRDTRGMPRTEKAIDFTTVWMGILQHGDCNPRWDRLVNLLITARVQIYSLETWETYLREVSRAIIATTISQSPPLDGFRDDILPYVSTQQMALYLRVPVRVEGKSRKSFKTRASFRHAMESRLRWFERFNGTHGLSLDYMDEYLEIRAYRGPQKRTFDDFGPG